MARKKHSAEQRFRNAVNDHIGLEPNPLDTQQSQAADRRCESLRG
jgi:hypothetical protein